MSAYPRGYQRWVIATKERGDELDLNLVQFATRYRFAGQLNDIELLGSTKETQETYLLALSLSLAYSAFEQLEKSLNKKLIPVKSILCGNFFKAPRNHHLRSFLLNASDERLKNRLNKLVGSKRDSDIRPVIEAIRHTMFHGRFNPAAAGLRSNDGRHFLRVLEQTLFAQMDEIAAVTFAQRVGDEAG